MKIMNKEIDFDDLFRRLLALPPKNEEWFTFYIPKIEIIVNKDMIILKKVKEIKKEIKI